MHVSCTLSMLEREELGLVSQRQSSKTKVQSSTRSLISVTGRNGDLQGPLTLDRRLSSGDT